MQAQPKALTNTSDLPPCPICSGTHLRRIDTPYCGVVIYCRDEACLFDARLRHWEHLAQLKQAKDEAKPQCKSR